VRRRNVITGLAAASLGSARRRDLLAFSSLASITSAEAQQAERFHRIAFVSPASPLEAMTENGLPHYRALLDELRRLGYVEGSNLKVERYSGRGRTERYPELVGEVVRSTQT
jgi:putative ABC transport system substrate-binding protein